jgi:hypothetical protein
MGLHRSQISRIRKLVVNRIPRSEKELQKASKCHKEITSPTLISLLRNRDYKTNKTIFRKTFALFMVAIIEISFRLTTNLKMTTLNNMKMTLAA